MTPNQKAKELVTSMGISTSFATNYTGGDDFPMYRNTYAKYCAIIAVNEILKSNPTIIINGKVLSDNIYWTEVKSEIEKL